jgi:RNA-directed DNA polymerase
MGSELKSSGKPFAISKREVWEAYEQVKANNGAPGADGVTLEAFEKDLKRNLYKIWNRMSSGSYFPPPVAAVEIPKPHGDGVRVLGVPTVADRIAQTVVAGRLEGKVEPIFHPDSYGYRPGRSALDAVAVCRQRCWKHDWVIDLDVQKFFDSVRWDLVVKAVQAHTDADIRWIVLCVIPEGAGTVNPYEVDRPGVGWRSLGRGRQPSARRRVNGGAPAAQRG